MKKKITLSVLTCLLLSACGQKTESNEPTRSYEIIKDDIYGCEYIFTGSNYSGIAPRLTKSGEQAGCVK